MKLLKARAIAERNGCPEIFMKESLNIITELQNTLVMKRLILLYILKLGLLTVLSNQNEKLKAIHQYASFYMS